MERIAPEEPVKEKVVTGEGTAPAAEESAPAAEPAKSDRPFLVYVLDPVGEGADYDKVEKVILQDERVAYGSRAFHAVRMSSEAAKVDPIVGKAGSAAPRFVVVSADFKTAVPLEKSRLTASATWDAMRTAASKFYAAELETTVKEMRSILIEYDKIAGDRKVLTEKKSRLDAKAAGEEKEIDAKLAALEAREQKAKDREQALWTLKPKSA